MRLLTSVVLGSCVIAAVGCKRHEGGTGEAAFAEEAIDSSMISEDEAALFASVSTASSGVLPATPLDAAGQIATHLPDAYPSCITVSRAGASVTVVFDGCPGPRGLTIIDGTVVFTVTAVTDTSLTVTATSTDLILNNASVQLDATATYSVGGGSQSIAVSSRTAGTGALGNEFVHTGDYTVAWDASCASVDGSWSTSINEQGRSTTASLERCEGSCPTGLITRDTFNGTHIEVVFDGTNVATWTSSSGRSGTVNILCN